MPAELEAGLEYVKAHRFTEGRAVFEQILAAGADSPDAFHLLGVCLSAEGRQTEALAQLEQAVRRAPGVPAYHHTHAIVLAGLGRAEEAELACRDTLRLDPAHQQSKLQLAQLLARRGAREEALVQYGAVLRARPNDEEARLGCAAVLVELRRYTEALNCLDRLLWVSPNHVRALLNRIAILNRLEKHEAAAAGAERVVALASGKLEVHVTAAMALAGAGRLDEAEFQCWEALRLAPGDSCALTWLARVELERGRTQQAEKFLRDALHHHPDDKSARIELGNLLGKAGRSAEALECFNTVVERCPPAANPSPARAPDSSLAQARFNRSMILLARGEWEQGWADYEYRWWAQDVKGPRFPAPAWDGSDPRGRRILLCSEQGLGDSIQFIRYARELAAAGAIVVASCQPSLVKLFANARGVDAAVNRDEEVAACDTCAALMSLPRLLGALDPAAVAPHVPYLFADQRLATEWAERVPATGNLRVGLVWAGSASHKNDRSRSLRLQNLRPLAALSGIDFFSLQIGAAASQIASDWPAGRVRDLGVGMDDTAAAMMNLDLIVSVDSALAHLAGALGRPVWVMLPFVADWRWRLAGDETAWYPTMRLFRQPAQGDWNSVIERIAEELRARRLLPGR